MTKKKQFLKVCNKQEKHQYKVVISIISSYFKQAEHFYLCTNSKLYMKFIVCGHITSNILNRDVEMISAHFDMSLQKRLCDIQPVGDPVCTKENPHLQYAAIMILLISCTFLTG